MFEINKYTLCTDMSVQRRSGMGLQRCKTDSKSCANFGVTRRSWVLIWFSRITTCSWTCEYQFMKAAFRWIQVIWLQLRYTLNIFGVRWKVQYLLTSCCSSATVKSQTCPVNSVNSDWQVRNMLLTLSRLTVIIWLRDNYWYIWCIC